ncbi:MAG: cadherin-like domain-containing protein, partial [Parvularculaceae bacterium]|nr:cadherin-like domain-containing protein [Parvularculaceae bacterium]
GNVVTFDKPLQYDHEGPRADLKAYVSNFSRNVVFENEGGALTPTHERGHVMLMHSDNIVVKYAEFDELGRTDKSVRSFDVTSLASVQSDSNVKGRYSLHIHRAGVDDQQHPAIVEGNAVWGSPGWGFVHHDSNAIFSNNAAYDVFGAAFVAETGNETGRWDHNIAIKSLGVDHITKDGADVSAFDLGRTGTGFWFQGRLVEAVGNVAASIPSGAGFTYFHRGADANHIPIDPHNTNLPDALRYLDSVRTNAPNITIFLNNESIATQTGLEIIKANPRQDHDLRSLLEGFTAWEVKTGVHLEYTGHYTIKDLDVVASDTRGIGNNFTVGVDLFNNVFDVVVNGANIEGFHTGVAMAKKGVAGLDFMNGKDQWDYIYIDVNVKGATYSFTNRTPGDKFLTAADLVEDRLSLTPGFLDTHLKMVNGVYNMSGTKLDSIGSTASYKVWDPDYINAAELRGSIEQNGYWTTQDGRRVAMIEEYAADRATGDVIKVAYFVEIPSTYKLAAGGFTRTTPSYNGLLNENSKAPIAVDDVASVQQGKSVVIDVLANDMDPDGDKIVLDGLFSQHGHVVMNKDGTVTYFADSNFQGEDVFYYFVQDANGDITKAQVAVTVDI